MRFPPIRSTWTNKQRYSTTGPRRVQSARCKSQCACGEKSNSKICYCLSEKYSWLSGFTLCYCTTCSRPVSHGELSPCTSIRYSWLGWIASVLGIAQTQPGYLLSHDLEQKLNSELQILRRKTLSLVSTCTIHRTAHSSSITQPGFPLQRHFALYHVSDLLLPSTGLCSRFFWLKTIPNRIGRQEFTDLVSLSYSNLAENRIDLHNTAKHCWPVRWFSPPHSFFPETSTVAPGGVRILTSVDNFQS